MFEIVVNRLSQKPGGNARSKPLFAYLHKYESQYGELAQIVKLEKRMRDLFPEDPQLALFSERFASDSLPSPLKFDPTTVLAIVSWKAQMRPALLHVMPSIEEPVVPAPVPTIPQLQETQPTPVVHSPRVMEALLPVSNSPKRPFDDLDGDSAQPRKMMRGESPPAPVQMQPQIQTPAPVPQYAAPPPMNQWGPPSNGMPGTFNREMFLFLANPANTLDRLLWTLGVTHQSPHSSIHIHFLSQALVIPLISKTFRAHMVSSTEGCYQQPSKKTPWGGGVNRMSQ